MAYTIVDEPLLPPDVEVPTDVAYTRWHGRGKRPWYNYRYKIEELEPWVPKVKEVAGKAKIVYGYFNNHYHGYAVDNCLQVLDMLGVLTSKQEETKKSVGAYFEAKAVAPPVEKRPLALTAFMPEKIEKMGFQELLRMFMDAGRIRRAKGVRARARKDREVEIQGVTDGEVRALIRGYHLLIDLQDRIVLHDCADWSRRMPVKQFCKHMGKVLMVIPQEKAVDIMRKILLEREKWEFKPYVV